MWVFMMVHFMYQLDWDTGCPDTWSNIILNMSVRCLWMRLTFDLADWVKQIAFPNVSESHSII